MGAGHDDVVVVLPAELGDHVLLGAGDEERLDPGRRAGLRQRLTGGKGRADDRDGDVRRGAVLELADVADEQALPVRRVALVEDDHGLGAGVLRVEGLEGEEARAPLDQGDVVRSAEVEPGEVGDLATAGAGAAGSG